MVPGGVNEPLTEEKRDEMLSLVARGAAISPNGPTRSTRTIVAASSRTKPRHFGNFPTLFLSLVTPKGDLEHYDGFLRIKDADGNIVEDMVPCRRLPASDRRSGRAVLVHEVPLLQADGLSARASIASARWHG